MKQSVTIPSLRLLTFIALFSGFAISTRATERGAWFWYQSSDPNGAANVVGNSTQEDEAIAFLQQWQITRLYGSYSNLPISSPATIAAWNKKLSQAGIESFVVLSDANLILPAQQANLQNLITTRLINFNNGRDDPQEQFAGVEFDLEPHTLAQWSAGTNADRRTLLLNLRDAFSTVRQQLLTGGYEMARLSAALPTWFDSSSTIGWTSSLDRDQWFADINGSLDTISLMAYETSNISSILSSTSYERTSFGSDAILALRSKLGDEWTTYNDFVDALVSVESQSGAGIDIESYYRLREIAPSPLAGGDYNNDGIIDAADYIIWRKGAPLSNDPIPGTTPDDYTIWRMHYGVTTSASATSINSNIIPEPRASTLFLIASVVIFFRWTTHTKRRSTDSGQEEPPKKISPKDLGGG